MSEEPAIPLDYNRPKPSPPSLRWLILLFVWTIGLMVWVLYFLTIGFLLVKIFV